MRREKAFVASRYVGAALGVIGTGVGPRMAVISKDGHRIATLNTGDSTVTLINTSSDSSYATAAIGAIPAADVSTETLAFTPNGAYLFVASITASTVTRVNTTTGAADLIATGLGVGPCACAITPDGSLCYVINRTSNNLSVIDVATATVLRTIAIGESLGIIRIAPNGLTLFVGAYSSNNLYRLDLPSEAVTGPIDFGNHEQGFQFTPDSRYVWVGTTQSFRRYSVDVGTLDAPIPIAGGATFVQISPNGLHLMGHVFATNSIWLLNTETGVTANVAVGTGPNQSAFSSDSTLLYTACGLAQVISRVDCSSYAVSNIAMPGVSVRIPVWHPLEKKTYCPQATSNNCVVVDNLAVAA